MKVFHCTHCDFLVFFENTKCIQCNHKLAFLPDRHLVGALEPREDGLWDFTAGKETQTYTLCANYSVENVCNWALPGDSPHTYCESCRFTDVVPDLEQPGNREAWYKLEVAKRRLLYTLWNLGCPLSNKKDDPEHGLTFQFLAVVDPAAENSVTTGHANGVITINVAEADDAERERRRLQLHEPYRTILGHFRHEVGHYLWDRLIQQTDQLDSFRACFGDERKDYAQALQTHYEQGPSPDWQEAFVSAYASAHPWEDWAETWAHYLHMADTLETAAACGLSLRPKRSDEPTLHKVTAGLGTHADSFERFLDSWFPVTYVLNNLNRGLGLPDGYPFALSPSAIDKLRFVHTTVQTTAQTVSTGSQ